VHLESVALNHHEGREDDEDLPPRARHELQRVVKPVAPAQDHLLGLGIGAFELREGEETDQRDHHRQPPATQ
jgi:hypothetical protein